MKQERLLEMTILLLNRKKVTAEELADHFRVSTRTIYRDLDTLSLAGIPVYTVKGKGGGIHLMENFTLHRSLMTKDEQDELLFSLQSLKATPYLEISHTLDKLSSLFQNSETNDWIEIDLSQWDDGEKEKRIFEDIKKAIICKYVVEMVYLNSSGEKLWRKVEPLKLFYKANSWYLDGYCRNKKDFRRFRLSRIKHLKLTSESFDRKLPVSFLKGNEKHFGVHMVHLRFIVHKKAEYRINEEFSEQEVIKRKDGNFEITTSMPENDWMYGYLLSYGEHITILEPQYVRENIRHRLEASIENYK